MNRIQRRNRLQFHQHRVLDQQVGCVGADDNPVIMNRDGVLPHNRQTGFAQFVRQGVFINLLKKTNPERTQNDEGAPDDFLRNLIILTLSVFICVSKLTCHPHTMSVAPKE